MLKLEIPSEEFVDDNGEIRFIPGTTIRLEHSLISISKWEQKHHRAFLESVKNLSKDETFDYVRCMCLDRELDDSIFDRLGANEMKKIQDYMSDPRSATRFMDNDAPGGKSGIRDKITSEVIYYWMISYGIPVEFEKWHINRLLTLIKVFNVKNRDPKANKMSNEEILRRNAKLNAQRRAAHHSRG